MKKLTALSLLLLGAAACGPEAGPVLLGAAGPWHGSAAMNKMGIDLAVAELNARPEFKDRPVQVDFRNDSGNGALAARIARAFVDSSSVLAVIGHSNSGTMVAAARVYDGHLVALSPTASSPDITGISSWTFRNTPSDSANGIDIARWAAERGFTTAAILYENNAYGRGLADAFRGAFRGEVVTFDPITDKGDQNFEPHVAFFKRSRPQLTFIAGTEASGLAFMREARRQRFESTFVGGDGWSGMTNDPVASEGVFVGTPFSPRQNKPEVQRFVEVFKRAYGGLEPSDNAAMAYDATMVLAEAVRAVGPDRERIRDYLRQLGRDHKFSGVSGPLAFTSGGDPKDMQIVMARVHGGVLTAEAQ